MDREIPPSGFTKSGKTLGKPRVLHDLVTPRVGFPYPHLYGMKESYSNISVRNEMFYLTRSAHFNYGYMASDIW